MAARQEKKNIVIIGGGIIGCTSAYFLSHHPSFNPATHTITLLEATRIAGGASGKAGGLLALWAYPSAIVPLSYRLHKELADKHKGAERWGYRAVHCGQLDAKGRNLGGPSVKGAQDRATGAEDGGALQDKEAVSLQKRSKEAIGLLRAAGIPKDLDWIAPDSARAYEEMGDPSTTAQVHPYMFTTSMAKLAEEKGVKVVIGSCKSINISQHSKAIESITYTDDSDSSSQTLPADSVVLSAGPWTQKVYPSAPISALRAHSVTIRPTQPVSAYALFTAITLPKDFSQTGSKTKKSSRFSHATTVTPEIYARPNNEVYACGEGDQLIPLPATTDLVDVDASRCQDIVDYVSSISDELRDGEVTARQACYLPNVSTRGGPIIGEAEKVKGLVIAAGHTCWGIQNAPATGKLVSEIVWDGGPKSANIGSLAPRNWGL